MLSWHDTCNEFAETAIWTWTLPLNAINETEERINVCASPEWYLRWFCTYTHHVQIRALKFHKRLFKVKTSCISKIFQREGVTTIALEFESTSGYLWCGIIFLKVDKDHYFAVTVIILFSEVCIYLSNYHSRVSFNNIINSSIYLKVWQSVTCSATPKQNDPVVIYLLNLTM